MFQKVSAERFILNQRCIQNLAKIVNHFQPLAISRKRSILDIWKGSECTFVKVFLGIPQISNSVKHVKPVAFIQIDVLFLIKTKSEKLTCRPGVPGRPGGPTLPYEKTKIYKNQIVGKKAEGRISKRVFQENKARQIFPKTNIFYPQIHTRTCAYQGVKMLVFLKIWRALFS